MGIQSDYGDIINHCYPRPPFALETWSYGKLYVFGGSFSHSLDSRGLADFYPSDSSERWGKARAVIQVLSGCLSDPSMISDFILIELSPSIRVSIPLCAALGRLTTHICYSRSRSILTRDSNNWSLPVVFLTEACSANLPARATVQTDTSPNTMRLQL